MEQQRICYFCKENMKYGAFEDIGCKSIKINGIYFTKSVRFVQYGWKCNFKTDYCDIIFDEKEEDKNKNKINQDKANIEINNYFANIE